MRVRELNLLFVFVYLWMLFVGQVHSFALRIFLKYPFSEVSGTTALGGMHLLAHSTSWSATLLGAAATTLSTVNIVGMYY